MVYWLCFLTLSSRCVKGATNQTFSPCFSWGYVCCRTGKVRQSFLEVIIMETRVAVMSMIVENPDAVEPLNALLHAYGEWIIGRMGIPYRKRRVSIISIALDAPQNTISALAGKIGKLPGVSVKTAYSGIISNE